MATIRCDVTSNVMNQLSIGSGTNETHLVLDANGKIGLGVQTPGEVLTVTGNISASGALTAGALTANGAVDLNATTLDIDTTRKFYSFNNFNFKCREHLSYFMQCG